MSGKGGKGSIEGGEDRRGGMALSDKMKEVDW